MIQVKLEETDKVIECLNNHGIVAFPTDTVFGLGCLRDDTEAIDKIYEAKNRSISKRLPVMVSSLKMASRMVEISEKDAKLFEAFAPGPITFIFRLKDKDDTLAIRMPDDRWILNLIEKLDKPMCVTSANTSGKASLFKYEDVIKDIGEGIDMIVKGDARGESSSTIVDCVNDYKILREGPISEERIREVFK